MKKHLINIHGIIITKEEYEKIKFNCDEEIRITLAVKRNPEGGSGIYLGEVENDRLIMKEGLFFDVKHTKVTTENEIWKFRDELMEYHEQQEQEKCRKCQEQKQ